MYDWWAQIAFYLAAIIVGFGVLAWLFIRHRRSKLAAEIGRAGGEAFRVLIASGVMSDAVIAGTEYLKLRYPAFRLAQPIVAAELGKLLAVAGQSPVLLQSARLTLPTPAVPTDPNVTQLEPYGRPTDPP